MDYNLDYKAEAREITDYQYFTQMLSPEWTTTRSTDEYSRYDATATNGNSVIYVELKGRDYELTEKIKEEGAYIECSKADFLYRLGKAAIIQFFWRSNVTYVWDIKDKPKWAKKERLMRKNNYTDEKVTKCVYMLPFDEENARYTVDLTDYGNVFSTTWEELSKNNGKEDK